MDHIDCLLCAGSPSIERYPVLIPEDDAVVRVDVCIGREIQALVNAGVKTLGCCCGHGGVPECLVDESSRPLLEAVGYVLRSLSDNHDAEGIKAIKLKTDVQSELRTVLSKKPWEYLPRMVPKEQRNAPPSSTT